jgi:hypothetical protein
MREEQVSFYSEGERVAAILRLPDDGSAAPYPAIVQGPGWLQLKEAKRNPPYHRAFTDAGFAVLVIDFRGFGESEGDGTDLLPHRWIDDLVNAVTYLTTRDDIDAQRIGTFGSGSTGGGNAIVLPAVDPRVRAAVSQMPIADGADWLRRMRREYEWYEFVERVAEDARTRVVTGKGEMPHPRRELMVTTPARAEREASEDSSASGHVVDVSLRSAAAIMAYRPIDVAHRVSALLIIAVADDPVTPTDHAHRLYDAARQPKKLIVQRDTTHYVAYEQYADVVIPEMVAWFRTHLAGGPVDVWETTESGQTQTTIGD